MDLSREKKIEKCVVKSGTDCSWNPWNDPQESGKETEKTGGPRKKRDHLDDNYNT